MGGYKQLKQKYEYDENNDQHTGTQVYLKVTGGPDDLPELGDPFSAAHIQTIVTNIKEELYGYDESDGCDNGYIYTISYEGPSASGSYTPLAKEDDDQRTFSAGGEVISIDNPENYAGKWYWTPTPTEAQIGEANGKVIQKIYKTNVVGSFGRTVKVSEANFVNYITNNLFPNLGKINSSTFESGGYGLFSRGTCLLNSASGSMAKNNRGKNEWVLNLSFSYKFIPELGMVDDTWQYSWRTDTSGDFSEGAFQVPIKKISDFPLYEGMMYTYADLNDVYSGIL